jgi:ribonuclease HI
MNKDCIVCFTDGSCLNNGKKHSKAGYAVVWPNNPELDESKRLEGILQTNNRAEFSALILAIEIANNIIDTSCVKTLIVYTDSMLLVNTFTKWMTTWKKKNWTKSDGSIVLNLDLIKQMDVLKTTRQIVLHHVKAHTNKKDWMSVYNDKVDQMARDVLL